MNTTQNLPPVSDPGDDAPGHEEQLTSHQVGPYRLTAVLGRGGMGVVYRAEQENPQRAVALKMLPPERSSPALRRRFEHETEVLARLSHPGIARIFTAGLDESSGGGRPYFAMELVEGRYLTAYAKEHSLGVAGRVELVLQLCDAVQHAHQQGIVHRDLKPGNVLVDQDGRVKVLDFGIAKLVSGDARDGGGETRIGDVVGTVEYMSPEQAAGRVDEVDTRSDVYAVGVILYQLLAHRLPFDFTGRSATARLAAVIEEEPATLGSLDRALRGDLDTIVAKAMEKDRNRRYATASELAADLRRYLADEPVLARPASAWYLLGKFARRRKPVVVGVALALGALITAAVVSSLFWASERDERKRKEAAERLASAAERSTRDALVDTAVRRGDWHGALAAVDAALGAGHPDTPRLRLNQVRALHALHDPRAAEVVEAAAARADLTPAERAECDLWQGDLRLLRDTQDGQSRLKKALTGTLREADREYVEGVLANSFKPAHDHLRNALKLDPFHHSARTHLSFLLVFSGRWDEAERVMDTGAAMFPNEPNFLVLRVILAGLRGDKKARDDAVAAARDLLGEQAAADLALAADALQAAFAAPGGGGPAGFIQFVQLQALLARLNNAIGNREGLPLGVLLPPVFEQNHKLLGQAFQRFREPAFADELGAAADAWPDTILYKAWGDVLMIQGRHAEAASAYEAGLAAPTMFPGVVGGTRFNLVQVIWMIQAGAKPEEQKELRAKAIEAARHLHAQFSGPNAAALLRDAPKGQTIGYVLVRVAFEANEHALARDILADWDRVRENDPVAYALRAVIDYFGQAYGPATESAKKAKAHGLKDPMLLGEMDFVLREAPRKLKEAAGEGQEPPPEKK